MQHSNQCRVYPSKGYVFENNTIEYGACQDCRIWPLEETKTVHYTACKKPWECVDPKPRIPKNKAHVYRLRQLTNRTTCHALFAKWFELREDFENQLIKASEGQIQPRAHDGAFMPHAFLGYCRGRGSYIPMIPPPATFDMTRVYGM